MTNLHLYALTIAFLFFWSTSASTKNELDTIPYRFFGLFAGDHLITGVLDNGQSLEIAEPYEYSPYFATVMKAAMLNNPALNATPLIQELQQNLAEYQRNFMAVMAGPEMYEKFCLIAIGKLGVGKRVLLPFGFRSLGAHAMLMEVRKLDALQVQIVIYNTGTGLEYHPAIFLEETYKILPFVLTAPISMKELIDSRLFFEKIPTC